MTTARAIDLHAGRRRVARTRGALSGIVLIVLGAWAAIVPFIAPYLDFGVPPAPSDAWHWTIDRLWLEVLPGGAAVLGGLLLLGSASRSATLFGAWLAALGGAWLIVGITLTDVFDFTEVSAVDPARTDGTRDLQALFYFYGIGGAILLVAGTALGRLSVHSVRDVRTAERRTAAETTDERRLREERGAGAEPADEPRLNEDQYPPGTYRDAGRTAGYREQPRVDDRGGTPTEQPPPPGTLANEPAQQYPPPPPPDRDR